MTKPLPTPSRPRFVAYVATSIDGRISLTKNTRPDWTSAEDWNFFQDALKKFDAVVVGRNTYQAAAERLRKRTTYVLSSRVSTSRKRGTVTFVNPACVDLASLLGSHTSVAILGGSRVYATILEQGLLDEIYVTIEPLFFGRGTPMMTGSSTTTQAELVSVQPLNVNGTLLLHYRILH